MINNRNHTLTPLPTFRARWGLPDDFTIACFEAKQWDGLGSVGGAGPALARVKQHLLEAVPPVVTLPGLFGQVDILSNIFQRELEIANRQIGLRQVEIEFAVAGFQDVLQAVAYRLIQLAHACRYDMARLCREFDFRVVYQTWLDDSVRVSATVHPYQHGETQFEVRVIYNAYGRVGLEVRMPDGDLHYVADPSLACPASGYMEILEQQVAQTLCQALARSTLKG